MLHKKIYEKNIFQKLIAKATKFWRASPTGKTCEVGQVLIICIIAIFVCSPMINPNLNIIKDDGVQHVYRIIGTENSIKENLFFPQIMSEFCNGFGYSWNIFYSPLTAFLPLIFKIVTNSYIEILKIFMFFLMFFSGIFMNKLVWKISASRKASLLSAIIYMLVPYHLTDMYARIAVAELASFVFLPIAFMGLYNVFEKQSKESYLLAIGMSGLILTHNVITLYTAVFCFVYFLIHIKLLNKEIIKKLAINVLITILVTSFYWVPLLEHRFATNYEVFQPGRMYNITGIKEQKLSLKELIYETKDKRMLSIGLINIIGIFAFCIVRKSSKNKKIMQIFLGFGIASAIVASKIFPFEYLPNIFKMLQFPWRMIEFSSFFLAVVTRNCISRIL